MAKVIEIIGNSVVVTDDVSGKTLLDLPRACIYYNVQKLEDEGIILMAEPNSNKYPRVFRGTLEVLLSEARTVLGQPFTQASVKSFFRQSVA